MPEVAHFGVETIATGLRLLEFRFEGFRYTPHCVQKQMCVITSSDIGTLQQSLCSHSRIVSIDAISFETAAGRGEGWGTVGAVDLGGSSLEVSFVPDDPTRAASGDSQGGLSSKPSSLHLAYLSCKATLVLCHFLFLVLRSCRNGLCIIGRCHSVLTLSTHCLLTVYSLSTHCLPTVYSLSTHCPLMVHCPLTLSLLSITLIPFRA